MHRLNTQFCKASDIFSLPQACSFYALEHASGRLVTTGNTVKTCSIFSLRDSLDLLSAAFTWSYNAQLYHDTYYPNFDIGLYLFFTSIIGGSIGVIVGSVVSDRIVAKVGTKARVWIVAVSQVTSSVSLIKNPNHIFAGGQLIAAPCVVGLLFLSPPYSFICLLVSYIVSEMWMGITFAILIDIVPKHLCSLVVGIFIFIMNVIGGTLPVVIDPLSKLIGYRVALLIFYPGGLGLSMTSFQVILNSRGVILESFPVKVLQFSELLDWSCANDVTAVNLEQEDELVMNCSRFQG